jgi:chromosome segregation ATPase
MNELSESIAKGRKLEQDLKSKDASLAEFTKTVINRDSQINNLKKELKTAKESQATLEEEKNARRKQEEEKGLQSDALNKEINALKSQLHQKIDSMNKSKQSQETEKNSKEIQLKLDEVSRQNKELSGKLLQYEKRATTVEGEKEVLTKKCEGLEAQLGKSLRETEDIAQIKQSLESANSKLRVSSHKLNELEAVVEKYDLHKLESKIKDLQLKEKILSSAVDKITTAAVSRRLNQGISEDYCCLPEMWADSGGGQDHDALWTLVLCQLRGADQNDLFRVQQADRGEVPKPAAEGDQASLHVHKGGCCRDQGKCQPAAVRFLQNYQIMVTAIDDRRLTT